MSEDGEVDPEEEEVKDQRNNDETNHPGEEVFGNAFLLMSGRVAVCRNRALTLSDFLQSKRSQRSTMTAMPIATTVRIPLTLEDQVQAMNTPVASIQAHQSNVNSLSNFLSVSHRGRYRLDAHW